MIQSVDFNVLDGQIGAVPNDGNLPIVVIGPSTSGTKLLPTQLFSPKLTQATFGAGPLVEDATAIQRGYGTATICISVTPTTAGTQTLVSAGTGGTSLITLNGSGSVNQNADLVIEFPVGGTIGTAGITYRYSLDGGKGWSLSSDLGTAVTLSIAECGASIALGTGTVLAGRQVAIRCKPPQLTQSDVEDALEQLLTFDRTIKIVYVCSDISTGIASALDSFRLTLLARGRSVIWAAPFRRPESAEADATYVTAFAAMRASLAYTAGISMIGDARRSATEPGKSWQKLCVPLSTAVGKANASPLGTDISKVDLPGGPLPGISLYDDVSFLQIGRDETVTPGAEDLRVMSLQSKAGRSGAYLVNPWVLGSAGSDYRYYQHAAVIGRFIELLYSEFTRLLSDDLDVSATTGYLTDEERASIEIQVARFCSDQLGGAVSSGSVAVALNPTDNVLVTETINVEASVVPKAYPKKFVVNVSFRNPARQ